MMAIDMDFNFYSDEPPKYFSRPATEFDGCDPQEEKNREEAENTVDNFLLGDNKLMIMKRKHCVVIEKHEHWWDEVFEGTYGECRRYCEDRVAEYEDSFY